MNEERDLLRRLEEGLPALRAYVRLNISPALRAQESCSDLVQSVCREIIEKRREFDFRGPESFRAWLYRWALHKIKDRRKFHARDKRSPAREQDGGHGDLAQLYDSIGTPSSAAIAREHVALLEQAFDRLDEGDRQVISLCRVVGVSREEAAEIMGKSVGAVRTHLSRALGRLGGELECLGVRE